MDPGPNPLRAVAIYCGSSPGGDPAYREAARAVGRGLAERGLELVYGGGRVGLMGEVADAALAAGGRVFGVITQLLLEKELGHPGLTELQVVDTMHERKSAMAARACAFAALPGSSGTLEEIAEVMVWTQLRIHSKPCALLNTLGYYDPLVAMYDRMVEERFLGPEHRAHLHTADTPEALLDYLAEVQVQHHDKWEIAAHGG